MHRYRSHKCSEIGLSNENEIVKLSGWVHRKRDHGNLLFLDLSDHYGIIQCVVQNDSTHFKRLEKLSQQEFDRLDATLDIEGSSKPKRKPVRWRRNL